MTTQWIKHIITICCMLLSFNILSSCTKTPSKKTTRSNNNKSQLVYQLKKNQYNIFVIISDAMRPDFLGCYGGNAHTPNIDWLAAHGAIFTNAHSTSPWTVPSSVGILTGNNPRTYTFSPYNKSVRINVPDKEMLLAEALQAAGYQTPMLVENPNAKISNNMQGFKHFELKKIMKFKKLCSQTRRKQIEQAIKRNFDDYIMYNSTYVWTDFLLDLPKDQPFYGLYWILDPHSPYTPSPKFRQKISVDPIKLSHEESFYKEPLPTNEEFSDYEKAFNKNLYLAEIESVDDRIGIIIQALKSQKLLDKTYIILTSDHGEQFGEHGKTGHGSFGKDCNYYSALVNVPLIIMGPQIKPNTKVETAISLIDLMPTLKKLIGVTYPENMQGKSFLPLLGLTASAKPVYFSNIVKTGQKDALQENNFKLIANFNGSLELYNLKNDSQEMINITSQYPKVSQSMYNEIIAIQNRNKHRLSINEKLATTHPKESLRKKQETIHKLKELGYIR